MVSRTKRTKAAVRDAKHTEMLWREYKATGSEAVRNELMESYLPLVRHHAWKVHAQLPPGVDVGDLIDAGVFGLVDAINGYDIDRGVKFETYAGLRIRGAMFDELRSCDWVPRLVRIRLNQMKHATDRLEKQFGRTPTEEELAVELDLDVDEIRKGKRNATRADVVSLSGELTEDDNSRSMSRLDVLTSKTESNPMTAAARRDLKDMIMKGLSRTERMIIILYYYEHMTMREIGRTLDISESRVSQMHSSLIARLKATLEQRSGEFAALIGAN